jgi:hypothetical protein
MAIVNRDKDTSEQREVIVYNRSVVAPGSFPIWTAPFNFEVIRVSASGRAISQAPTVRVDIKKFGGTDSISMMVALAYPAYGTSGAFTSASLAAAGSSHIQGAAGDQLWAVCANNGTDDLVLEVIVKKLQDIVTHFGA